MDFMINHSVPLSFKLYENILNETLKANVTSHNKIFQLYFDGASRMDLTRKLSSE